MRAVIQRVKRAAVRAGVVGDPGSWAETGRIDSPGLFVLLGVTHTDTAEDAATLAAKTWGLRIFDTADGERSAADLGAPLLVVSQFTLYGDTRKGRRPSWTAAAPRRVSEPLYEEFCSALGRLGATVAQGRFGAPMEIDVLADGPITVLLEVPAERTAPG